MHKKVVPIKEISTIEGVLDESAVGIFAFRIGDNIVQKTTTFIYLDKNIYIFFTPGEEEFKKMKFDRYSSFTILKNLHNEGSSDVLYNILSITIRGKIRLVDDPKAFQEILKGYNKKYRLKKSELSALTGSVIIDTEEIQAYEESGG